MAVVPVLVAPALRRVLDVLPAAQVVGFTDFGAVVRLPGLRGSIAPGVIAAALLVAVLAAVGLARWRSRGRPEPVSAAAVGVRRRRSDGADAVHRNVVRRAAAAGVRRRAAARYRRRGHPPSPSRGTWPRVSRIAAGSATRSRSGSTGRCCARWRRRPGWRGAPTPAACTSTSLYGALGVLIVLVVAR